MVLQYLRSPKILLIFILLLGLFFRTYKLEIFYSWGHDQDLFAWIAKDIMIDRHLRLIGQETSITGVFIGPLFYYLMALPMALLKMNPLAAYIPVTIISLLTIFSIYYVFAKFFGRTIGLLGSFLYAVSPGIILLDRWIVPTQPTNLWVIWYLYVLFSIIKGRLPLLLLGILIGLIWHVHIAFIPLLLLFPAAFWLSESKNRFKISIKSIVISAVAIFILMLPFFAFEFRHGFQQIQGLTKATYEERGDVRGVDRLIKVFNISGRSLAGIFMLDKNTSTPVEFFIVLPVIFLMLVAYLYKIKMLSKNQLIIFSLWIGINLLVQFVSKRSVPEYYFANLFVVFFLILAILISTVNAKKPVAIFLLLGVFLLVTAYWFIVRPDEQGGLMQRRKAIEYIKTHSASLGYPCIAINYIEGFKGIPNGFRYLFWLYNLKIITSGNDVPVYSIVTPWTISEKEISKKFGAFGIIDPAQKKVDPKICNDPNRQLLPLWGFTN